MAFIIDKHSKPYERTNSLEPRLICMYMFSLRLKNDFFISIRNGPDVNKMLLLTISRLNNIFKYI